MGSSSRCSSPTVFRSSRALHGGAARKLPGLRLAVHQLLGRDRSRRSDPSRRGSLHTGTSHRRFRDIRDEKFAP
jgi:hypothetical protein